MITITIPGEPVGKGRPRFNRYTGTAYTPKETIAYENLVRMCYTSQNGRKSLGEAPIKATLVFYYPIAKSLSNKKKEALIGKPAAKKPDLDNVEKIIFDALNGLAYKDDCQICEVHKSKEYSQEPHVSVLLEEMEADNV